MIIIVLVTQITEIIFFLKLTALRVIATIWLQTRAIKLIELYVRAASNTHIYTHTYTKDDEFKTIGSSR